MKRRHSAHATRGLPLALAASAAMLALACAETDRDRYVVGDTGSTSLRNPSDQPIHLEGCSRYRFERRAGDAWRDAGPAVVCVWEGFAERLDPGERAVSPLIAPGEPGTFRLVYRVGGGCRDDAPMSEAHCDRIFPVATPPFDVVDLCKPDACGPPLGMPNRLCDDGVTVGGPTGRCLRDPKSDACFWEVVDCP